MDLMNDSNDQLNFWIRNMATLIEKDQDPNLSVYLSFLQTPKLALNLIDIINAMNEEEQDENSSYYSACLYAFDLCVAELQAAIENNNKSAEKAMNQLMDYMAKVIVKKNHSLSFWLAILNTFYEVHVELSDSLKVAYLTLTDDEEFSSTLPDDISHINAMQQLILELSDLSVFDITENFFAQSYAMPPDFFADLIMDLYSIEEGMEIALLSLLHPKPEIREVIFSMHEHILPNVTLSSTALSRLKIIQSWYPAEYQTQFNHWIREQRKKGVTYKRPSQIVRKIHLKASEIDGGGAQGIFIHLNYNRKHRLGGLLYKSIVGIKDVWMTTPISRAEVTHYYNETFEDNVTLRVVDIDYLVMITNHFLAVSIEKGNMPGLHLLELQEELGCTFIPERLDVERLMEALSIQISPFTEETMRKSLDRSKAWIKNKAFTSSWFIENINTDKLVNQHSSFIEGAKICNVEKAMQAIFQDEMEPHRKHWLFHFLWNTLWLKAHARPNEKLWQDSFYIAYAIQSNMPLLDIPIMREICQNSVFNSLDTMQERRTHLSQEKM